MTCSKSIALFVHVSPRAVGWSRESYKGSLVFDAIVFHTAAGGVSEGAHSCLWRMRELNVAS